MLDVSFITKSKINLRTAKYKNVDIKVLWKKGIASTYDCNNPAKFFSYISSVSHDPKFVIIKKQTELASPLNKISVNLKCLI